MSQWRIKGYVADSDEEDDLDFDDFHTPRPPAAKTASIEGPGGAANFESDHSRTPQGTAAIPLGSQDELSLDSSQTGPVNGLCLHSNTSISNTSPGLGPDRTSPPCGPHAQRSISAARSSLPASLAEIPVVGHPSSEIATESTTNALSTRFLATQLFSDDQLASTPHHTPQPVFGRPVTPTPQHNDVDELQQGNNSAFSSPLSDARSDIECPDYLTSSPPLRPTGLQCPEQDLNRPRPLVQVMIPSRGAVQIDEAVAEEIRMSRGLRKRNPIQLHPYLLEAEKYKQNLKARGLRPVNVGPEHHRQQEKQHGTGHGESQDLDSQDRDFVVDHTQSSSVQRSSPIEPPSSPPNLERTPSFPAQPDLETNMHDSRLDVGDEDVDFPDLSVLLRKRRDGTVQEGFKRRKILHTFSNKGSLNRTSSLRQPASTTTSERAQQTNALFDGPPSPPTSEALPYSNEQHRKTHRPPLLRHLSPIRLQPPTPATSSTRKPIQTRLVVSDSDDEPPISTARHRKLQRTASVTVLSSESSDSSEHEETRHEYGDSVIEHAKRRIKGVLPASWLRLDQKAQATRESPADPSHRQRRTSDASLSLGSVASSSSSRRASPAPSDRQRDVEPVAISDHESESGTDPASATITQPRRNLEADLGFADSFESAGASEIQEHDWVDPMLPSGSRRNTGKKNMKKRQTKLTDSLDIRVKPKPHRLDASERPLAPKVMHKRKSKQKAPGRKPPKRIPRNQPPELSILDAPFLNEQAPAEIPQFLKIAVRQARQHPNKGRHSPTNKLIRLQTEADTEEANVALRDWRAGRVKRSARDSAGARTMRPPLHDRVANQHGQSHQQHLPEPEKLHGDKESETNEGLSGLENHGNAASHSETHQTTLQPVVILRDASPAPPSKQRRSKPNFSIAQRPTSLRPTPKQPGYRTAQLERAENEHESQNRSAAFRRKLLQLDRIYASANQVQFRDAWTGQSQNPRLARFLRDDDEIAPLTDDVVPSVEQEDPRPPPTSRRRLKAKVRRIDVETREFRQPSDPVPHIQENVTSPLVPATAAEIPRLEGLGLYGTRYPTDFDVSRLWSGTFFHESTMIGSGEFQRALNAGVRDMDAPAGITIFSHDSAVLRWGAWTEEVASEMASLWSSSVGRLQDVQSRTQDGFSGPFLLTTHMDFLCVLRSISRYFSTTLHFLDPVDRRSFVSRMRNLLDSASTGILADLAIPPAIPFQSDETQKIRLRVSVMLALLALQVIQIEDQQQAVTSSKESPMLLFMSLTRSALQYVLRKGMDELRSYIDENRRHAAREQGIREDRVAVETVVVVHHMLLAFKMSKWSFWDLVRDEWSSAVANYHHVQSFERLWYDLFSLLPYLEIDSSGLVKPGHGVQSSQGDWSVVVPILNRLLSLYTETAQNHEASINSYVRACLTRCYNLVHAWGWTACDSLLYSIFDFFSRRGCRNLQNEDSKGSPRFLEDLHQHPRVEVQPDDTAFNLFLKIVALGLKCLRLVFTDKRIENITWRLVPNHRRTCYKEEDLRQEDLDAIRNQHDLLCTVYWASPPGHRPRLISLRKLVDQQRSHREICRLHVRAWSNLARYQISTTEGVEPLEPFADWFKDIISESLAQYRLAKTEAESQYEAARASGNDKITPEQLRLTIRSNQAHIAATLGDAVYGMKAAMTAAHEIESATSLLNRSSIIDVFKLFSSTNTPVSKLIAEVLGVFQVYLGLVFGKGNREESQNVNDDSQDYGSSFSLEDVEPPVLNTTTSPSPSVQFLHDAVWQLVSNCFGADTIPDDALLTKVVETWTMVAHHLVCEGHREWTSFLNSYHANSWSQLPDTEQTRRYSALFMATVLDQDARSYDDNKDGIFCSWFMSLVERESTLKFQHRLTTSLINRDPAHPLLRNLPFLMDPRSCRVDIRLSEFRQRRLSLISSVLSNIRDDYERAVYASSSDVVDLRRGYAALIKQLMAAMKKNYIDLGQNASTKGAYVEFVHNVVEFLQQHTQDICLVDPFFTDSSAFPLPATDPTYVVGRLKSYVPKLMEQKTLKQLVFFVQNVSERAAGDNEQEYLTSQLIAATVGVPEQGDVEKPTLRHVFLCAIFPAYIEQAFKTAAGWILAKPLIRASRPILEELGYQHCQYSVSDPDSVATVDALLSTMLDAMYATTELLITHSGLLEQPHFLHILALVFEAVAATVLPAAHLFRRTTGHAAAAIQRIEAFRAFSLFVAASIADHPTAASFSPYPPNDPEPLPDELVARTQRFDAVRQLCARDLAEALGSGGRGRWVQQGECYFLVRKNGRSLVQTGVGSLGEERERVVAAVEAFHARLRLAFWEGEDDLREKRKEGKRGRWPVEGGEVVVI